MKTIFTVKKAGAKFSPAEMYLANRLRTLKSVYSSKADKNSFMKHMMAETDGKSFTKSECERIFKAMHVVAFYDRANDVHIFGMDKDGKLLFKREDYSNNSNFFENYAKQLFEEGMIIVRPGRPKGFTSPAIKENLAKMRAAKAAKKAGSPLPEDIFHVEPPKEEEEKPASNLFDGLSLSELEQAQTELAAAIQNRREEILGLYKSLKGQIEDLERQVTDLEAKNPWLKQL